jgi:hypothetical protein
VLADYSDGMPVQASKFISSAQLLRLWLLGVPSEDWLPDAEAGMSFDAGLARLQSTLGASADAYAARAGREARMKPREPDAGEAERRMAAAGALRETLKVVVSQAVVDVDRAEAAVTAPPMSSESEEEAEEETSRMRRRRESRAVRARKVKVDAIKVAAAREAARRAMAGRLGEDVALAEVAEYEQLDAEAEQPEARPRPQGGLPTDADADAGGADELAAAHTARTALASAIAYAGKQLAISRKGWKDPRHKFAARLADVRLRTAIMEISDREFEEHNAILSQMYELDAASSKAGRPLDADAGEESSDLWAGLAGGESAGPVASAYSQSGFGTDHPPPLAPPDFPDETGPNIPSRPFKMFKLIQDQHSLEIERLVSGTRPTPADRNSVLVLARMASGLEDFGDAAENRARADAQVARVIDYNLLLPSPVSTWNAWIGIHRSGVPLPRECLFTHMWRDSPLAVPGRVRSVVCTGENVVSGSRNDDMPSALGIHQAWQALQVHEGWNPSNPCDPSNMQGAQLGVLQRGDALVPRGGRRVGYYYNGRIVDEMEARSQILVPMYAEVVRRMRGRLGYLVTAHLSMLRGALEEKCSRASGKEAVLAAKKKLARFELHSRDIDREGGLLARRFKTRKLVGPNRLLLQGDPARAPLADAMVGEAHFVRLFLLGNPRWMPSCVHQPARILVVGKTDPIIGTDDLLGESEAPAFNPAAVACHMNELGFAYEMSHAYVHSVTTSRSAGRPPGGATRLTILPVNSYSYREIEQAARAAPWPDFGSTSLAKYDLLFFAGEAGGVPDVSRMIVDLCRCVKPGGRAAFPPQGDAAMRTIRMRMPEHRVVEHTSPARRCVVHIGSELEIPVVPAGFQSGIEVLGGARTVWPSYDLNRKFDLATLAPGEWLNDKIVNGGIEELLYRDSPNVLVNSLVFTHYITQSGNVKRHGRAIQKIRRAVGNLYESDTVVYAPYNLNKNHWVLLRFDFGRRVVDYYDSMQYPQSDVVRDRAVAPFLALVAAVCESEFVVADWAVRTRQHRDAMQKDLSSCGVFTIMWARRLVWGIPFERPEQWRAKTLLRLLDVVGGP